MNKKRIVSLGLALSLVAGSMGLGFAAVDTTDVQDKNVKAAVERLAAFGIVNGMEDGKYHPELKLTREQFAKIVVEAMGIGDAAKAAQGSTYFNDIAADRWSAGYISIAVGQGILKGYPDGTFRPTAEVSYSEAVTMLVRALGYKDEFLAGSWPGNYVAKAADVGVTDDVKYTPEGVVDRGSAAIMVDNTLDSDIVKALEFGNAATGNTTFKVIDKTLLEDKLGIYKYEEAVITGTPASDKGLDKDQIRVKYTKDYKIDGKVVVEKDDTKVWDVKEGVTVKQNLGESVNVFVKDSKDEVVYVEKSDKNYNTMFGAVDIESDFVKNLKSDSKEKDLIDEDITVLFADGTDKDYSFDADGVNIFVDNKEMKLVDFAKLVQNAEKSKKDVVVKFVTNNKGKIGTIEAQVFEKEAVLATEAKADTLTYIDDRAADKDATKVFKAKDYDKVVVTDNKGNTMKLEDIKKNDVVYINDKITKEDLSSKDDLVEQFDKNKEVAYVLVVRSTVEAAVNNYNQTKFEIKVDGKNYDVSKLATVSSDNNRNIEAWNSSRAEDMLSDITDGAKALVIFDAKGYVRHIDSAVKSSSQDMYGVITGIDKSYKNPSIKVLGKDEKKATYEIDFDKEKFAGLSGYDSNGVGMKDKTELLESADKGTGKEFKLEGALIKYNVNKDGEIDKFEVIAVPKTLNVGTTALTTADFDFNKSYSKDFTVAYGTMTDDVDKDSVQIDKRDYNTSKDIVVFDYNKSIDKDDKVIDPEDAKVVDFNKLDGKGDKKPAIVLLDRNKEVQFMSLLGQVSSSDETAAYVSKAWKKSGDDYVEMSVFGKDGKLQSVEVDSYSVKGISNFKDFAERVIVFNENSDGTIEIVGASSNENSSMEDYKVFTGRVTDVSGSTVKLDLDADGKSDETFKVESNAVVFEGDDSKSNSDIDEEDFITVAVKRGKAEAVKLYDEDENLDASIFKELNKNGLSFKEFKNNQGSKFEAGTIADQTVKVGQTLTASLKGNDSNVVITNARPANDSIVKVVRTTNATVEFEGLKEGKTTIEVTVEKDKASKTISFEVEVAKDGQTGDALKASDVSTKAGAIQGTIFVKVDFPSGVKEVKLVEVNGTTTNKDMEDGKFITIPGKETGLTLKFVVDGKNITIEK